MFSQMVCEAIDHSPLADAAKTKLRDCCLPWLDEALRNIPYLTPLMVAAATTRGATVFAAEALPQVDHDTPFNPAQVALEVHRAIERNTSADHLVILRGMMQLLRREGLRAMTDDAELIVSHNGIPIIVVLALCEPGVVSVVCTVAAFDERRRPTLH